jgi:cytochrome b561
MHEITPHQERWGVSIIALHWVTAACVVILLITGWQLGIHAAHIGQRTALLQWHASISIVLLLVTIVRLLVRLAVKRPLTFAESRLRRLSAGAIQVALYLTLLALIVTGIVAATPRPFTPAIQLFGIWSLPKITDISPVLARSMPGIHAALVWTLLGLVVFHVFAATYGTLIRGDGTIFRMLPWPEQVRNNSSKPREAGTSPSSSSGELPRFIVMGRTATIAVLVVFLVLVGAFLSIPFWVREGAQQLSQTTPLTFQREIGKTNVMGTLASKGPSLSLFIDIDTGIVSEPASMPDIIFDMTDHPMAPQRPNVRRLSSQRFTAQASLPMPGRWRLQVILPQGRTEIPFNILP